MSKLYPLILCLLFFTVRTEGQVANYSFSQSSGSYTPISGNVILAAGWDNGTVTNIPIPFTFTFNGIAYSFFSVNANGYITFGSTASSGTTFSPISSITAYAGAVSAFGRDLISNGSTIETAVAGVAPNRAFIIQWNNAQRNNSGAVSGDQFNFQIILQEGGGVVANQLVQVVYGTCTVSGSSSPSLTAQVGLRGATNADYNNRSTATNWSATTAGTGSAAFCTSAFGVLPSNGLTFTWAPPPACVAPANQPTVLVLSSLFAAQVNGSFTAAASAPSGYLVVRYPAGATPTDPVNGTTYSAGSVLGAGRVVQSGAGLSFSATGLAPSTAYDFYVYAFNNAFCTGAPAYRTVAPLKNTVTTPPQAPPSCVATVAPLNGAIGLPVTQVLSWSGAFGSPSVSGYMVYMSVNSALVAAEDPSVRVANNIKDTSFTPAVPPNYGTTYYWKVVPVNALGAATGCAVNSFTTYVPATVVSRPGGGLWSSTATWLGGVLPIPGDDVVITDGSVVTVDMTVSGIRNLNIGQGSSGVLQWGGISFVVTLFGNLTIANGGRFLAYGTVNNGQTVNIGGNLINNGFANLAMPATVINMNGSQQPLGSLNQSISGTGNFAGTVAQGIVHTLSFRSTGSHSITSTRSLVTGNFIHTAGSLNTNGKLSIDNTAQVYGQSLNTQVANIVVTGMGINYNSAPVVFGGSVVEWTAAGSASAGTRYYTGSRVYLCTQSGTFNGTTAPTHTSGIVANGSANLLWLAPVGTLGNPFGTSVFAGTQYFYGGNLYLCTVTGTADVASPPVHVTGTVASGTASFRYVGSPALVSVNYDAASQTVRSLNLVNVGSGYSSTPTLNFSGGGGFGIVATVITLQSILGPVNSTAQKSGGATITGGLNINSTQGAVNRSGVGAISATNGGANYTVAPTVGFAGPTGINLVAAGGSGFISTPSVTVTGGTLVSGTSLTSANFTVTANQGRVISVYLNAGTTAAYSVPPTLSITDGGGTGAVLAFPPGCWPTATAVIGTNGQITNFTVTNAGYGYVEAPAVRIGTVSGTALGGTFTTLATGITCRVALYNLTINTLAPATAVVDNPDDAVIPASRKMNTLTLGATGTNGTAGNLNLTGNLELFGTGPLFLLNGILNMGGNNLLCSWPGYRGSNGSLTTNVTNATITLSCRGGGFGSVVSLSFPFDGSLIVALGSSSSAIDGASITSVTVSRTAAPTGATAIGSRGYRVVVNPGAVYGSIAYITMSYNVNDALLSDQQRLFIGKSTSLAGPWAIKSQAFGTGTSLPATGSLTSTFGAPSYLDPIGDDYYAWVSTFTPIPLAYNITRSTGITYNSIMETGTNLLWGAAGSVFNDDITANVSLIDIAGGAPTFQYQGQPITGFSMCSNGWVKLNTATSPIIVSNEYANNLSLLPNLIAPFWEDLDTYPSGTGTRDLLTLQNSMKYKVIGTTAGSRQFVIEWKNMTNRLAEGAQLDFQVVLNEADNSIAFHYGRMAGFNGNFDFRYSYSMGLTGQLVNDNPLPGQVLAQQFENTTAFSNEYAGAINMGANGLMMVPACNSSLLFTPGTYTGFTPPPTTPPANDEAANAFTLPALSSFPHSLCGHYYSSRYATASAQVACAGNKDDDVWFRFTAGQANMNLRVYGSGAYRPRVQVLDAALNPLSPVQCAVAPFAGRAVELQLSGLAVSGTYYVRVYHEGGGTEATATATINVLGQVAAVNITNGGSGYSNAFTGGTPGVVSTRVRFSGGGGRDAAGTVVLTGDTVSGITLNDRGYGYTSAPTVTIEKPNWAHTGEFAIVLYPPISNDECAGAKTLTNLNSTDCVEGANAITERAGGATASNDTSACGNADDDLWYRFTATGSFAHIKLTATGPFAPTFQVFDGGAGTGNCVNKQYIACKFADPSTGVPDTLTIATIVGNTYFIRVYHFNESTVIGENFTICVTAAPPACVTAPTNPANGSAICRTGTIGLSWPAVYNAFNYDLYLDAGTGPATTLVATQTATSYNAIGLPPGNYNWRVVPKNLNGTTIGCSNFGFTVNPLPAVSITPAGTVNVCAPATQALSLASTSAASPSYQWVKEEVIIPGQTSASYSATSSGRYYLLLTDGVTGCSDTSATVQLVFNTPPVALVTPTAVTISCDSAKLSAVATGLGAIKITELTLFRTGTGATPIYPAYIGTTTQDFVEISNIGSVPFDVGGFTLADYSNASSIASHPYTIPIGTILPPSGTLLIHLGTGTDDVVNRFFNTGGITDNWVSNSQMGIVLKDSYGSVVDALGCGGSASGSYTFATGTGVTAADWSGFAPNVSGSAGLIRIGPFDANNGSNWVISNTPVPLQTIGNYNGGYSLSPLPVSWLPTMGLFTDAALTTPYTGGNLAQVFAKPGSTTTYALQPPALNGCFGPNAIVTVTVLPPSTIEWIGAANSDWVNPANWKCGTIPTVTSNVIINSGVPNNPVVNQNVEIKSLTVRPGAVIIVNTGFELKLNGN